MHCCGCAATITEFFTRVFNWKLVRLPPCPCVPRPPTCLPFRLRSRWSGRPSGWPPWFASAPVLSASRPDLSRAPAAALLGIAEASRQDVRVSVGGQNRHTAARVATIILRFSLVGKDESVKGEIPPALVLKYPSISIMLLLSCLVF